MARDFQYSVLVQGARPHIRLLRLHPGRSSDPIRCDIFHSHFYEVSYEALSYCWGEGPARIPSVPILCNDATLRITPSLYTVLKYLRSEKDSRVIWADGICINQNNTEEKTQQVSLMRDIYRSAQRTLVWLGEADIISNAAIELLHQLASAKKRFCYDIAIESFRELYIAVEEGKQHDTDTVAYTQYYNWVYQIGNIPFTSLRKYGLPDPDEEHVRYMSLWNFLAKSWFTRVWVIQEVAVAKDAVVQCGTAEIGWSELADGVALYSRMTKPGLTSAIRGQTKLGQILKIEQARQEFHEGHQQLLRRLVLRYATWAATDPRDKIFALLGLANSQPPTVFPDYGLDFRLVYRNFAKQEIESGSLEILFAANGDSEAEGLPSWVSWGSSRRALPFWGEKDRRSLSPFSSNKKDCSKANIQSQRYHPRVRGVFGGCGRRSWRRVPSCRLHFQRKK